MLTVQTPPETALLATIASLQVDLGAQDGSDGLILSTLLEQASAACASFCGRSFGLQTVTESYRSPHQHWVQRWGRGGSEIQPLVLTINPVQSITSVAMDGNTLDPSEYECDQQAGLLYRLFDGNWTWWKAKHMVVGYTAGWLLPNDADYPNEGDPAKKLPMAVQRACIETVKAWYFAGGANSRDPMLRSDATQNVGSSSWVTPDANLGGLPPSAAALLGPYRVFVG